MRIFAHPPNESLNPVPAMPNAALLALSYHGASQVLRYLVAATPR